jgi:hypothetical protein
LTRAIAGLSARIISAIPLAQEHGSCPDGTRLRLVRMTNDRSQMTDAERAWREFVICHADEPQANPVWA